MRFKILSWNIWGGQHLSEIIDLLRKEDADIVGLQEVIEDLDGTKNTAKIIAEKLGYEWVFVPTHEVETARLYALLESKTVKIGNAVLSRQKISESITHELSMERKRLAIEAVIPIGDRVFHIFSTHLVHTHQQPSELQSLQAKNLLRFIPVENALLMGDFNATPQSDCVQILADGLETTDRDFKPTWSVYPEGCNICVPRHIDTRLDYIFTSKDIKTASFAVLESKGSDHLPISVMIEV